MSSDGPLFCQSRYWWNRRRWTCRLPQGHKCLHLSTFDALGQPCEDVRWSDDEAMR